MLRRTVGLIPRFRWEYSLNDTFRAVGAATLSGPPADGDAFSEIFGLEPIYTTSGRTSLYIILKALGLKEGSGVGVPLFCCSIVFETIVRAGLKPVFIDCEENGCNISASDLRKKLPQIYAVVVPHMFGVPADMDAISEACGPVPVIEDCAHSLLSTYKGTLTGLLGTASFFSFRSGKCISAGQGGAILARDPALHRRILDLAEGLMEWSRMREIAYSVVTYTRSAFYRRPLYGLVSHPIVRPLEHRLNLAGREGFAFRKMAVSHRMHLRRHLPAYPEKVRRMQENAAVLREHLPLNGGYVGVPQKGSSSNAYIFAVTLRSEEERNDLSRQLLAEGIDTAPYMDEVLEIARSRFSYKGDCPRAAERARTVLVIPHYDSLSGRDLLRIAVSLKRCSQRGLTAVALVISLFLLQYFYMLRLAA